MKKSEQEKINNLCIECIDNVNTEICEQNGMRPVARLRTCQAWVFETDNYYILRSYNTLVAFIDKRTDTLYDVLRFVFGFTSTSSQHIAKFAHDYKTIGKWQCEHRYTYR